MANARNHHHETIELFVAEQYLFDKQWTAVKVTLEGHRPTFLCHICRVLLKVVLSVHRKASILYVHCTGLTGAPAAMLCRKWGFC